MPISSHTGGGAGITSLPISDGFGQASTTQLPSYSPEQSTYAGLPMVGYTPEQLTDYVMRQLGSPTWEVELTKDQIMDAVVDGLGIYSQWCPRLRFGSFRMTHGQYEYLQGINFGQGIVQIDFVEPNPVPTEIFYGNLIDPAPLFRTGLDEYDIFLRWRKTWMRITSVQPQWLYDEARQVLLIHNPLERYHVGLTAYTSHTNTVTLPISGAQWVKEWALESSRYLYGEILSKYNGAIPGPVKDLQLDTRKRENAQSRLDKLRERVQNMQVLTPIFID